MSDQNKHKNFWEKKKSGFVNSELGVWSDEQVTIFQQIVSAETIFFLISKIFKKFSSYLGVIQQLRGQK